MTQKLRAALEGMIQDEPVKQHPAKLAMLAIEAPHSICVISTPLDEPLNNFNCVMHTLGLITQIEPARSPASGRFYADIAFLNFLLDHAILRPCAESPGALVVWSVAGTITHAGIVVAPGRVVSKWGSSHVYEHALLEVPANFGDELSFYGAITTDDALNHLVQFWTDGRVA